MPYLGNTPTANFATVTKDTFSGNASTTAFTLSKTATTNGVAVYVENVRQIPTTAYAVSGTTLTFTGAPPSGTNNIYVMHHNTPVSTATHPAAQDLTAVNGTLTGTLGVTGESTLTGDATLSRSNQSGTVRLNLENTGAGGSTDYSEIKFNSTAGSTVTSIVQHRNNSGMNIGTSTAHPLTLITSGNTAISVDADGIVSKPLQPAFQVNPSSDQTNMAHDDTLVFDNEVFDNNGDFASNTFTAPVTGKYLMAFTSRIDGVDTGASWIRVEMQTSNRGYSTTLHKPRNSTFAEIAFSVVVDMDSSDTCFLRWGQAGGSNSADLQSGSSCAFSGVLVA